MKVDTALFDNQPYLMMVMLATVMHFSKLIMNLHNYLQSTSSITCHLHLTHDKHATLKFGKVLIVFSKVQTFS